MSQRIFWDPNLKYGNPVKCGKIHEGQRVKGAWFRGWNVRWSEGLTRVSQRVKSAWVRGRNARGSEGEMRVGQGCCKFSTPITKRGIANLFQSWISFNAPI